MVMRHVGLAQRPAAGAAEAVGARRQSVADADPFVEDEAFAAPQAVLLGHVFEIIEDAALEMIDLVHPLGARESGRFLAADPAGAEHGDSGLTPLALKFGALGAKPFGKFAEAGGLRIDRAFEGTDLHFVIVARVDHDRLRIRNQRVPVLGRDIGANPGKRIEIGLAHGHDLFFQPHLGAVEGHDRGARFLDLDLGAAGQRADMVERRFDTLITSGDCAVDAFLCQQQSSAHGIRFAYRKQRRAQRTRVVETRKLVQRGNTDGVVGHGHGCAISSLAAVAHPADITLRNRSDRARSGLRDRQARRCATSGRP